MTKCKFYMRNGAVIEITCEKLTARVNQIMNALVGYSIEGWKSTKPLYIAVSEVIAVTSTEIEQNVPEKESAKSWISVKDRLPEKYKEQSCSDYVLFVYDNEIHMGSYDYNAEEWISENGHFRIRQDYVTHWLPLPELPELKGESEA